MPDEVRNDPLKQVLREGAGYAADFRVTTEELADLRRLIQDQWLDRIRQSRPDLVDTFAELGIERYHEQAHLLDHGSLWAKESRLLSTEQVMWFRQTSLVRKFEAELGRLVISDEDQHGWEEVYWRLVRPNEPGDVGSAHADHWFAELRDEVYPEELDHVKCWIGIFIEPGLNGLEVLDGSHRRQFRYHGEDRRGKIVPVIDEDVDSLGLELLHMAPGDVVVFDDRLLHRGALNRGTYSRVSLEFEMLVEPF